ncbi:MAG: argininosuccinate lyase [Candidatus Omnitrophica bacterium]|nr:argininosuccinate lyase [Candidatus Omnitrophota bacterium]
MSKKLWGGRFKKAIDKDFEKFSKSIQYDFKLARVDVFHSIIHTFALSGSGLLNKKETKTIISALNEIIKEIDAGKFKPDMSSEDIHTDIHNRLEKKIGKLSAKVHTLRSRNDQIVFNEKFYCLDEAISIKDLINEVLKSFLSLMKKYDKQPFIGYTHTQRAQVILFSDYLSAFGHMLVRDSNRIKKFYDSVIPYIGAGALAGTSLHRKEYFKAIDSFLSFDDSKSGKIKSVESSIDNVSDRDFIMEFLNVISIIQMHLSRLSEDIILYSTQEFDYLDLPEEFCTGSSLMPHKKNPDFLELVRGYTGRIYGNQVSLMTTMKGLPMTYNRDMQLDKEPLFSSVEIIKDELKIMAKFIKGIRLKKKIIAEALLDERLYAAELAEFLVFKGIAFKDAHDIVGKLIRHAEDNKTRIKQMPDSVLKTFCARLNSVDVAKVMRSTHAITSKKSIKRKVPKPDA